MKDDQLKAVWQGIPSEKGVSIKEMLKKGSHPVQKRMRRQMLIEGVAYLCFLLVYFDFFDGNKKPVYANVLLVAAFVFAFINNVIGFTLAGLRMKGNNIGELLQTRIGQLKVFVKVIISSRALLGICLMVFFGSVITFSVPKVWILAGIMLAFGIQLIMLWKIWSARINRLKGMRDYFN